MRFRVLWSTFLSRIRSEQSHFQRLSDRSSDFLLNRKDIFQFAIERSCPELNPVGGVHEFGHDAHPFALFPDRAIQKRAHAQLLTNRPGFLFSVFEPERRAATNHFEPTDLSQSCDQFFRQAIRKIFILRVAAFVDQWKDSDRLVRTRCSHLALSRRGMSSSVAADKEQTDRERRTNQDNV